MCPKNKCKMLQTFSGCDLECYCNYSCFDCWDINSCGYPLDREEMSFTDIRSKFVCFPCKRVWKSNSSKYIMHKITRTKGDSLANYAPNLCKQGETRDHLRSKYAGTFPFTWNWDERYSECKAKCPKCGQKALPVGRNFRHCSTEKHWKEMEEKVKKREIDLCNDFRSYPREGKQSLYDIDKFKALGEKRKERRLNISYDEGFNATSKFYVD